MLVSLVVLSAFWDGRKEIDQLEAIHWKDELDFERHSAIFRTFAEIPSDPVAFVWLRSLIALETSFTFRRVNFKDSMFDGAASGTNSDSTSLELAKREDAIDVK